MDAERFDRMTRWLASERDRRRVVGGLVGVVASAGLGIGRGRRVVGQAAPPVETCAKDIDCAETVTDPCTGSSCIDGVCATFVVECAPGFTCCGDAQCCATGGCQADAECPNTGIDPCTSSRCQAGGCVQVTVACAAGSVCCGAGQCCPLPCLTDLDCAIVDTDPCNIATCVEGSCVSTGLDCGPDGACCAGVCYTACRTGQTFDAACQCIWLPATRRWRRFLED